MILYTIAQAAKQLATTEGAIERLLSSGQLPYIDVCVSASGRKPRKRIREDDLIAFVESRRVQAVASHTTRNRRRKTLPKSILRLL